MAQGGGSIAVKRRVMVSGDQLTKATQGFDQDGRPDINITFNTAGARRFGRATQENVGKPFAIILDDKVLSYPNINEPILGGRRRSPAASRHRARTTSPSPRLGQAAGEAQCRSRSGR